MVAIPPESLSSQVTSEVPCPVPVMHGGKGRGFPALTLWPKREPSGNHMPAASKATGANASSSACNSA